MPEPLGVYFLDVGQGDCSFILPPAGAGAILLDCNDAYVAERFVIDHGITHLSAAVVSHLDAKLLKAHVFRTPHHGGEIRDEEGKGYADLYDPVAAELSVFSVGTNTAGRTPTTTTWPPRTTPARAASSAPSSPRAATIGPTSGWRRASPRPARSATPTGTA